MRYIVIMAGGVGSRFWPSSTEQRPKQFLDILGIGKSLLQMTYERSLHLAPKEQIMIVTNKMYVSLVAEQLPDLPFQNILAEPSRNNTAPCIALAMLVLQKRGAKSFAVLASDHVILKEDDFVNNINVAFDYAENNNAILTLSIEPTRPDSGYGYIEVDMEDHNDIKKVISFKEKPDLATAKEYLLAGTFSWNSGIFIWSVDTLFKAYQLYAPEIIHILTEDTSKLDSPEQEIYLDKVYQRTPNISVDYAILEKANNVYTVISDLGWSDIGTWASLHAFMEKDNTANVLQTSNSFISDVEDCIIKVSGDKRVIIKGLKNFIVIDEADALLIYPKDEEQDIKALIDKRN